MRWTTEDERLPVAARRADIADTVAHNPITVVTAPPGSGKTIVVPRLLVGRSQENPSVWVLEPRRLAARLAAEEIARREGVRIGGSVGLAMRDDRRVGPETTLTVMTAGYAVRRLQSESLLDGIGTVIIDEFHERGLDGDFALALLRDIRTVRDDLRIVLMSATLDAADLADRLDAAVVHVATAPHPLDIRFVGERIAPHSLRSRLPTILSDAAAGTNGSVLAFVPRRADASTIAQTLGSTRPRGADGQQRLVRSLHGGSEPSAIRELTRSASPEIVIATSIAESSVTLPHVDLVVDAGWQRTVRVDQRRAMGGLVTEHVSRASADQRAGRAARLGPGAVWKLWSRRQDDELLDRDPPEIERSDLLDLVVQLAAWGADDTLPWLDPPPGDALSSTIDLGRRLGLLGADGRLTATGRAVARQPRSARAGLIVEGAAQNQRKMAVRLADAIDRGTTQQHLDREPVASGPLVASGYADRIARNRGGGDGRFLTVGGTGVSTGASSPLARENWIVAVDVDFVDGDARVRGALAIDSTTANEAAAPWHVDTVTVEWPSPDRRVVVDSIERLGAIELVRRPMDAATAGQHRAAVIDTVAAAVVSSAGRWLPAFSALDDRRLRVGLLRAVDQRIPDELDVANLRRWLEVAARNGDLLRPSTWDVATGLWWLWSSGGRRVDRRSLDRDVPATVDLPNGQSARITYTGDGPTSRMRVQRLFGITGPVEVAGMPVRFELLSPADRPVAVTDDPGRFWEVGWPAVRAEMRGRYPRHAWPENGATALPPSRPASRRRDR